MKCNKNTNRGVLFAIIMLFFTIQLFNSCSYRLHISDKSCRNLINEKKEQFMQSVDYLLNDDESNINEITADKSTISEWREYKYVNGIYWVTNDDMVHFDENYSGFIAGFMHDNRIISITIYKEEQCVEFHLSASLSEEKDIIFSKTGEETPDKYIWKEEDYDDNWYLGEARDTPRS